MRSPTSMHVSSDVHMVCRFSSLSVVIVSAMSVVLQGPLTPPPSFIVQSVTQIVPARPQHVGQIVPVAQVVPVSNAPQRMTPSQVVQAPEQEIAASAPEEKPAVGKGNPPAQASALTQKSFAKKPEEKRELTLETYTRCVARALDVDEPLAVSVLIQESHARNPMQRGRRGSRGPLQVQPIALQEVGLSRHERSLPVLVYGGLRYLKTMMARFDNLQTALAAYNMGPTSLVKRDYRPYRVTQRYVRQVLNRAGKIRSGDVPSYPVLQYPMSHRDLPSRHHKIEHLQGCLMS